MRNSLGTIAKRVGLCAIFGGAAAWMIYPKSDSHAAEQFLKDNGYSIVEYSGKLGMFERTRNEFYADRFIVENAQGVEQKVVVGRWLLSNKPAMRFENH